MVRKTLISSRPLIQRPSFHGGEAGGGDDLSQFGFVGMVAAAGRADDVLLDHHRAQVVGAEVESNLADVQPLREPARLYVLDVVEINS